MTRVREWFRRLVYLVRRDRATRELEEEMRLHRELRAESLRARGASADEATAAATQRFGSTLRVAEDSRSEWGFGTVDELMQDLRYAARRLRQRPGFTFAVAGVLALGIGATTAMFSAVDAAMLRPLPFTRAAELFVLPQVRVPFDPGANQRRAAPKVFDITDIAAMSETFSSVAAYASGGLNLADPDRARRIRAGVVSASFFGTIGVRPAQGRTFSADDATPGAPRVVVLSWGVWQDQLGGRDIAGAHITLSDDPYEVIGVMPRGFAFPEASDVWIPMSLPTTFATFNAFRGFLSATVIARAAPGVTARAVNARVLTGWKQYAASIAREPKQPYPVDDVIKGLSATGAATPLRDDLVGSRRRALLVLFGATGLLLLIACTNVMSLLLSYGAGRRRELAVRAVLGASRRRVVRQLLVESVMLSVGGAAAGVALAPLALRVLRALMPAALAGLAPAQIDWRVLGFAAALGVVTGVAFGLWPALGATRVSVADAVKSGGGHGASARGTRRLQHTLVGAELALTVMLLIGAGLMLRSFSELMHVGLGIRDEHAATLEASFAPPQQPPAERYAKVDAILDRLRATPGITSAGVINDLPLRGAGGIAISVTVPGAHVPESEAYVRLLIVSEDYFAAIGHPIVSGRGFRATDNATSGRVAIVNKAMAKTYWNGADPVGRTFTLGGDTTAITVVGMVANVPEAGLERRVDPQMFFPARTYIGANMAFVARGDLAPRALLTALTGAIRAVDPAQAVYNVRMMDEVVGASVASRRANTTLIVLFGLVALAIAALGVHAVAAYAVAQREREFGIRSALGATGRDLARHVGGTMLLVMIVGVTAGVAGAWALARIMSSLLYGVTAHDPRAFAVAPLVLLAAAVVATIPPARRALRVNPVDVMRGE